MWDYSEKVMEHYRNPKNAGVIDNADAIGEAGSLSCGDMLKLYLKVSDKGIVEDAKFQTFGCGSAVASASILTEMVIGKHIDELKNITNKQIADELGGLPPAKMHCSVMGHEALINALKNYFKEDIPLPKEDKIVCSCFYKTEDELKEAISKNQLTDLEGVAKVTKAGSGCGQCKDTVLKLLKSANKPSPDLSSLTKTQFILKVNNVIETSIADELRKDNGDIELVDVDVESLKIYVKLKGSCAKCKNSDLTLKFFVENTLKEHVSPDIEVIEV